MVMVVFCDTVVRENMPKLVPGSRWKTNRYKHIVVVEEVTPGNVV
jgi:hypothetical protein